MPNVTCECGRLLPPPESTVDGVTWCACGRRIDMLAVMSGFLVLGCVGGISYAGTLQRMKQAERRLALACPCCMQPPPVGQFWRCTRCGSSFDPFATAFCPKGCPIVTAACWECGADHPQPQWSNPSNA